MCTLGPLIISELGTVGLYTSQQTLCSLLRIGEGAADFQCNLVIFAVKAGF